jgi:hypothetical protein
MTGCTMKKILQLFCLMLLIAPAITLGECIEGDCANGFGVYIFPEGGQYAGQFAGGEFAGPGSHEYADGNRYEGMFDNSTPHGEGTLTYADGSVYSGRFDHGVINGQGSIVFPNGSSYEGPFKNGLFHGSGTYTFADGSIYKGEFKKGRFDGKGSLLSDGRLYVGEFREGEHSGKGTITYYDKSKEIGEWKDGEFIVLQKIKAPIEKKSETAEDDETFGSWETEQESFYEQENSFPENNFGEEKQ